MTENLTVSRRAFMRGSAAAGLVVAIGLPTPGAASLPAPGVAALGAFLRIAGDGSVTVVAPCVEMGQGSHTALAMIVADEAGADWTRVSVVAPPVAAVYRTPGRPMQNTSGSQMVRRWNTPLRKAAAAALPEPAEPTLRSGRTIVGGNPKRLDIPSKVNGSAVYGIDVRVPGMLFAAIRQAPVFGGRLVSVDDAAVRGRSGVVEVVRLPNAVAVVADSFWRAKTAADALEPTFSAPSTSEVTTDDIMRSQRIQLDNPVATVAIDSGGPGIPAGSTVLTADYSVPFLHHATMEPMACTAHLTEDRFEFWVPTQNLTGVQRVGAKVGGLPPERIVVNATLLGGGFGRKFEQDFVEQAALIAKAVKRPVKLVWTREEDVQHGF